MQVSAFADSDADRYIAAGGVVVHDDWVLVLRRPSRGEVRLPKGHVEPGEDVPSAALRETREESGYTDLVLGLHLGTQEVEFDRWGRRVVRTEHYFLMTLAHEPGPPSGGEEQFEPVWLSWDDALAVLTFEPEREWLRRALAYREAYAHRDDPPDATAGLSRNAQEHNEEDS